MITFVSVQSSSLYLPISRECGAERNSKYMTISRGLSVLWSHCRQTYCGESCCFLIWMTAWIARAPLSTRFYELKIDRILRGIEQMFILAHGQAAYLHRRNQNFCCNEPTRLHGVLRLPQRTHDIHPVGLACELLDGRILQGD